MPDLRLTSGALVLWVGSDEIVIFYDFTKFAKNWLVGVD